MASTALTFHLPEEANPAVIFSVLETWAETPQRRYESGKALIEEVALSRDVPNRTEPVAFATRLGLIEKEENGLALSSLALRLTAQREAVRHDLLHFLAYTAWSSRADEGSVPFWSYRGTCDALWELAPAEIDGERARLVEHVIGASRGDFDGHPGYNPERVSYSPKSLRAILKWLEALTPPVVAGGVFQRRPACSSELLLLALGHAYRQAGAEPGVELLLTGRARETVARLCLIDPAYLDRLLDWALARHAALVERADRAGAYGRAVRLGAVPTVESVLTA